MRRLARRVSACSAVLLVATAARADVTIDTTPAWNGSSSVYDFAYPDTSTYGQTLTVPTAPDTVLSSYTFYVNVNSGTLYLSGYVYAWDGNEATGPQLYKSPEIELDANNGVFQPVTISPNVDLVAGQQYVAFLSISEYYASNADSLGYSGWGQPQNQDVYSGGSFVFTNNGGDTSQWFNAWSQGFLGPGADLAFQATFTGAAVPEPASFVMLGLGGIGLAGLRSIRRRKLRIAACV